jgi:hypothetical protein
VNFKDPRYLRMLARMARRDKCGMVGRRAGRMNDRQAATAWRALAAELEELEHKPLPKFADLFGTILRITQGRRVRGSLKRNVK